MQLGPKDLKPELIYTRISGYGQTGPKAQLPGYASVCEAFGGFRYAAPGKTCQGVLMQWTLAGMSCAWHPWAACGMHS